MKAVTDSWNDSVTKINNSIPEDWKKKGDEIGRTISTKAAEVSDYLSGLSLTAYERAKEIPTHVNRAYDYVSSSISDYMNQNKPSSRQTPSGLQKQNSASSQRSFATSSTASIHSGLSASLPRNLSNSSLSVDSLSSRASSVGSARQYPTIPKITTYEQSNSRI